MSYNYTTVFLMQFTVEFFFSFKVFWQESRSWKMGWSVIYCTNVIIVRMGVMGLYFQSGEKPAKLYVKSLLVSSVKEKLRLSLSVQGHQGTVMSLTWSFDSIYLSSAGVDGAVFSWFMDGFGRYAESVTIGSLYSTIVYDPNRKYIYGCGPNIPLRAIDTDKKYEFPQMLPEEVNPEDEIPEEEDGDHSGSCWEHHIFRLVPSYSSSLGK